jgi:cytochrome c556
MAGFLACREQAMSRAGIFAAAATALVVGVAAPWAQQQPQQPPAKPPQEQQKPPSEQQKPQQEQQKPQQEPQGRGGRGGNATPARPLVPAAASSIATSPDRFVGQLVTMTGTIEQLLGKLAFSVDQDRTKSTGQEVLVIPARLNEPIQANSYVTVIGDVIKFDPAEVEKRKKTLPPDLTPDVIAKYQGKPAILATAVINAAMVDVAKFIPPPLSPEEAAFDKVMKAVGPANAALRKGLDGTNAELVRTNTAVLKKSFTETEAFWKARDKDDAQKFAADARKAVELIELAAAAGKWEDVKTHVNTLGQQCSGCHGVYRERLEDGSFAIKPGMATKGGSR